MGEEFSFDREPMLEMYIFESNQMLEKLEDIMHAIPLACRDPFNSAEHRLRRTLDLYKYDMGGKGLMMWATAQTGMDDPLTKKPTLVNPYYDPKDGVFPLPGLGGIKQLQEQGTVFCVCDMARKVNAMFVAKKMGLETEDVYNDFVEGTLPGIMPAPSGVWVLGRLAENKIAYIDASVG